MTSLFIKKSIEIHGDTYDYSKVVYENNLKEVIIICKEHGEFLQLPKTHKRGNGCIHCALISRKNKRTKKPEQFIVDAIKIHGDTYDYSKVEYIKAIEKVIIICKEHGEFEQTPNDHLSGKGCKDCAIEKNSNNMRKTNEQFIIDAIKIHGDIYDYSKVEYIKAIEKVIIICKEHGEFEQTPNNHLRGAGCKICSGCYKSNNDEFAEKSKIIHGDIYDYSKVEYIKANEKVIIICKKHGDFELTPNNHLNGQGCNLCINKTETKLYEIMKKIFPNLISQFKQEWCKKLKHLPFDFCIPEYKIIIELDGRQHFQQVRNWSSPEEQFENDKFKEKCANNNGYSVIRLLQEDVFHDTYDWVKELCDAVEEIKTSNEITNIYLSKNDEYDNF
jgi:very-short-patch-repair endonuclease